MALRNASRTTRVEVHGRDLALLDELHQFQGLAGLELDRVDLVLGQKDIVALFVLETLLDLVLFHLADAVHHLGIVDRLAGGLVDLPEGGLGVRLGRGEHLHRDRDEGQSKLAFPDGAGACRHGNFSRV